MKKYLMMGVAAVAFASCSHDFDLYDPSIAENMVVEKYNQKFIEVFGQPAANQTWGFGTATRGLTRSLDTWTDTHSDDWFGLLDFSLPESYITLTTNDNTLRNGNVYYVPADFSGTINFDNFNGDVYVAAEITDFWGNPGNVNVYVLNGGAWKKGTTAGSLTIYNQGTVELGPWDLQTASNIPVIYNGGTLKIGNTENNANIADAVKIYSKTDITIYGKSNSGEYEAIDLKCSLDIHGTVNVPTGNLKIQNSKTQHVCGLNVAGILDMTQGKLESSYIKANEIKFDGSYIWLLPGGHIQTNVMRMPNSATAIYGESSSTGLIEVKDIYFQNTNNFDDSFSGNIYFKITGEIDFTNSTKFGGQGKHYGSVDAYNAENTTLNGYNESDYATGNPACGNVWTVGTPDDNTGDGDDDDDDNNTGDDEFTFLCRVFAEDLSVENATDFDFNDVVFDVYTNGTDAKVTIKAAGGTLPLKVAGYEVHELYNVAQTIMVNTGATNGRSLGDVDLPELIKGVSTLDNVNEKIKIVVTKGGVDYTLYAEQGKPAAKFAVTDQNVDWVGERTNISTVYKNFNSWVETGNPAEWWK